MLLTTPQTLPVAYKLTDAGILKIQAAGLRVVARPDPKLGA